MYTNAPSETARTREQDSPCPSLGRARRAIARILLNRYHIHPRAVIKKFGWRCSETTVLKAAANKFSAPDKEEEDEQYLPSDIETIINEVSSSILQSGVALIYPRMMDDQVSPVPAKKKSTKDATVVPASALPGKANTSLDGPCSQNRFLRAFVEHYGLDSDTSLWFNFLAAAGCNESNLRRMSRLPPAVVKEFIETHCPRTTVADRLVFT
ncbi:hypothetical protein C8R43DRAFT_1135626 [Mycena crocata]|nr:hypothetical protein C8R43DRAFT_1135626 [Mycena crocata]